MRQIWPSATERTRQRTTLSTAPEGDTEGPTREGSKREQGRSPPQDLRGRNRCHGHRLGFDVGACLINVDLQKHLADAQGGALAMGDDDPDPWSDPLFALGASYSRASKA